MISRPKSALALACAALALAAGFTERAEAAAPLDSFATQSTSTQAGAHGDLLVQFSFDLNGAPEVPCDCNWPKEVTVDTPPGFLGFPTNIPRCTLAEFATHTCPVDSQVGVAYAEAGAGNIVGGMTLAVFNMVPSPDQAALLAFPYPYNETPPVFTSFTVRTESDFGAEAKTFGILNLFRSGQLFRFSLIVWGTPGDPSHETLRWPFGGISSVTAPGNTYQFICHSGDNTQQLLEGINPLRAPDGNCANVAHRYPEWQPPYNTPYNATVEPFLTNPTNCSGPLESSIDVLAYDTEHATATAPFPAITGCDQLSFNPSLSGKADHHGGRLTLGPRRRDQSPAAFSPGDALALADPRHDDAPAEGFTVNSNAADGKVACTDVQARFGTREEAQCPEFAKIGTLQIHSSALPGALPGALYLGEPLPGNRYRVFLTADGFGLHIKLAGLLDPDPVTGQVVGDLRRPAPGPLPALRPARLRRRARPLGHPDPVRHLPGEDAPSPPGTTCCPSQTSTQFFTIDSGPNGGPCPSRPAPLQPEPRRRGRPTTPPARHTSFALRPRPPRRRPEPQRPRRSRPRPASRRPSRGSPTAPRRRWPSSPCSSYSGLAEQAAPACPAASQVGTVVAGAGAGHHALPRSRARSTSPAPTRAPR